MAAPRHLPALPVLMVTMVVVTVVTTTLPDTAFVVEPAPFLLKSHGRLVEPTDVLTTFTDTAECDCLSRCLTSNQCLGFSYHIASGNCTLNRVRGSRQRTLHRDGTLFRIRRHMAYLGDWCTGDVDCQQLTGGTAVCRDNICSCADVQETPLNWTTCGVTSTPTAATETTAALPTSSPTITASTATATAATTTTASTIAATTTASTTAATTTAPTTAATTTAPTTAATTTAPTTAATTTAPTTAATTTAPTTTDRATTTAAPFQIDVTSDECVAHLSGESGQFTSPNYPANYEPDLVCTWHIEMPSDQTATIRVLDFKLEDKKNCVFDNLKVWDGDSDRAPSLGQYCSTKIPLLIGPSSGRHLTVRLSTDYNKQYSGFHFKWAPTTANGMLHWKMAASNAQYISRRRHSFYLLSCFDSIHYPIEMVQGLQDPDPSGGVASSALDSIKCVRMEQHPSLRLKPQTAININAKNAEQSCQDGDVLVGLISKTANFNTIRQLVCATVGGGFTVDRSQCESVQAQSAAASSSDPSEAERWTLQCSTSAKVMVGFSYLAGSSPAYQAIKCCQISPSD